MTQSYTTLSSGLTTIFTPPASCSSSWTYEAEYYNAVSGGLLIQNVLSTFDTSCWPASFTGNGRVNGNPEDPIQLFSPGICPSGYTTAAGFTQSGTTSAICCLKNFAFVTQFSSQNYGTESMLFEGCVSTYPLAYGSTIVEGRAGFATLVGTTVTGPLSMWAQPLWVEHQETDLSLFSTTSSSTTQPSSTNPPPFRSSSSTTATPTTTASQIPSSSGLSTGARAGIGVGAGVGALLVIAVLLFFRLRRRGRPKSQLRPATDEHDSQWQKNELSASEPRRDLEGSRVGSSNLVIPRRPLPQQIIEVE